MLLWMKALLLLVSDKTGWVRMIQERWSLNSVSGPAIRWFSGFEKITNPRQNASIKELKSYKAHLYNNRPLLKGPLLSEYNLYEVSSIQTDKEKNWTKTKQKRKRTSVGHMTPSSHCPKTNCSHHLSPFPHLMKIRKFLFPFSNENTSQAFTPTTPLQLSL
jgi:hypothetical protein